VTATSLCGRSAVDIFAQADTNHDGSLDVAEFEAITAEIVKKHPQLRQVRCTPQPRGGGAVVRTSTAWRPLPLRLVAGRQHMQSAKDLFAKTDVNHDGTLSPEEFADLLGTVDSKLTALPATAQVASQQGRYLATLLTAIAPALAPASPAGGAAGAPATVPVALGAAVDAQPPFQYHHLGSMAYVGRSRAVIEFNDRLWSGGLGAFMLWRSAYMSRQVSTATRINLAAEWAKRPFVGRNLSRY